MPRLRMELNNLKEDLSAYFTELAHGIKSSTIKFTSRMDLIGFATLDIVTALFHSLATNQEKERMIWNIREIANSLERHHKEDANCERPSE